MDLVETAAPAAISQADFVRSNTDYWTMRSTSYSSQHQNELAGSQHAAWSAELRARLTEAFPDRQPSELSVLDIGCGPGFFSIILAELGYRVTAVDYTPSMLDQARANARACGQDIVFLRMDAEALSFATETFDAVVTRNLTWNLPHPSNAYREWQRVLRPEGLLLNYDANWYLHLSDDAMRAGYEADRRNVAATALKDRCLQGDVNAMEAIASRAPLSFHMRPAWDRLILEEFGFTVRIDPRVSDRVWIEEERVSQASTPLFGIYARKPR